MHLKWMDRLLTVAVPAPQLPESLSALTYSNILCGVIRGAMEMVRVTTTPEPVPGRRP
eukprot:SAG22_NODE_15398_length_349_cov_1.244000_2_plen_57_part_01